MSPLPNALVRLPARGRGAARCAPAVAATVALAAALLAACAAPPTRYYTLAGDTLVTGAPAQAGGVASGSPAAGRLYVEVGPVGVPERLARPQIVVRSDADPASTRVDVLEQQRWSASFDRELRDAFAVAVAAQAGAVDVTHGGLPPGQPVYQVSIQLRRFDATPGTAVDAAYGWTIRRSDDDRNTLCQVAVSEPVGAAMDAVQHHRETVQPIREKTGGSTFKNPPGTSAWKEIDAAGCRGLMIGGAQMSPMHCNFMINTGTATGYDLEYLGETVRARVLEHSGIRLEWEIKRLGQFTPGRKVHEFLGQLL